MNEKQFRRAQRLKQKEITWLCTVRKAPAWITPKDQPPYRPYLVLVLEPEADKVRQHKILEERPPAETVLAILLKAMLRPVPGSGQRYRPALIVLDDRDLVQELTPQLADLVRCNYRAKLSPINAAVRSMEAYTTEREPRPGLLSAPGVTVPLVGELFAAAADYYSQSPWRRLADGSPIEATYDGRTRYLAVMGNAGEAFGLASYESPDDLSLVYSGLDPFLLAERISWFSLMFDEPRLMAFEDLDAMEKYDWLVMGELAYPVTMKSVPPGAISPFSAREIAWMAAALRVTPDFVLRQMNAGWGRPRPAEETYSLPDIHGGQKITLRYPVKMPKPAKTSRATRPRKQRRRKKRRPQGPPR